MHVPLTITHVAEELSLPVDRLVQRSVRAFLLQEIRAAQLDIGDFQDRYGVVEPSDLRARIERGEVYSHPAWEDAIEWEHLESYMANLNQLLAEA